MALQSAFMFFPSHVVDAINLIQNDSEPSLTLTDIAIASCVVIDRNGEFATCSVWPDRCNDFSFDGKSGLKVEVCWNGDDDTFLTMDMGTEIVVDLIDSDELIELISKDCFVESQEQTGLVTLSFIGAITAPKASDGVQVSNNLSHAITNASMNGAITDDASDGCTLDLEDCQTQYISMPDSLPHKFFAMCQSFSADIDGTFIRNIEPEMSIDEFIRAGCDEIVLAFELEGDQVKLTKADIMGVTRDSDISDWIVNGHDFTFFSLVPVVF